MPLDASHCRLFHFLQHEKRPGGVSLRIRRDFPSTAPMMWGLVLHGIELEFADDSL
jgi:hypothetical protein